MMGAFTSVYQTFEEKKIACRDCSVGKVYDRVVCSDGSKVSPTVMVIGEAPGRDEVTEGKPFVGKAGKVLRAALNKYGFRKRNTVISNVIPCRPENNKFPTDKELVQTCADKWLFNEMKILQPKYLLLLGNQPLRFILGIQGITRLRGNWYPFVVGDHSMECMPTFHPSYVCRKEHMSDGPEVIKQFEGDIKRLAERAQFV
jgi:DNA polymerase